MAESNGCAKELRKLTRGGPVSTSESAGVGENCVAIYRALYIARASDSLAFARELIALEVSFPRKSVAYFLVVALSAYFF